MDNISPRYAPQNSAKNMMIQMQTLLNLKTTFMQQYSIVLKLFVPLVVLLLPGQNLQNQNHQQTF